MWKTLHYQLNIYHKTLSIKDYCSAFIKLINPDDSLWSIQQLEDYLSLNTTADFFPEVINLHNYFSNGDYRFIANYIFHFPNTNKSWFDIDNKWGNISEENQYKRIFDDSSEFYILKKAIFDPEILLSKDDLNSQLTYLFLLFLPAIDNYGVLYHHYKKIPLICCNLISNNNFDMLLELMNQYDKFELDILSKGKNMNHILMEDFMTNSAVLYAFDPEVDWNEVLPLHKIHKLLDLNCGFQLFSDHISKNSAYMFDNMPEILIKLEKEYMYSRFNEQLAKNDYKKEEISKL
jgi:hypothetical protein